MEGECRKLSADITLQTSASIYDFSSQNDQTKQARIPIAGKTSQILAMKVSTIISYRDMELPLLQTSVYINKNTYIHLFPKPQPSTVACAL